MGAPTDESPRRPEEDDDATQNLPGFDPTADAAPVGPRPRTASARGARRRGMSRPARGRWLEPAHRVDEFEIVRHVGAGAVGDVYLARDTVLGRRVALKFVRLPAASYGSAIREARALAALSHPGIVTLYRIGQHDGVPYVALEFVEGETLARRWAHDRPTDADALRIVRAVAEVLDAAHGAGVAHCDLKPSNLIVDQDGRIRVLDFGIARLAAPGAGADRAHDDEAQIAGTPSYMAPEQWAGRPEPASDLYALGIIAHKLLCGRLPYVGTADQIAAAVVDPTPAPRPDEYDRLDPGVADVLIRCLAKPPGARPHARAVLDALAARVAPVPRAERDDANDHPFRGLQPFTERQTAMFFGRDGEIERTLEQLRATRAALVVGPSGSGKSSLVRAGIVPRLREARDCVVHVMRPGTQVFASLAAALEDSKASNTPTTFTTPMTTPGIADPPTLATEIRDAPERIVLLCLERFRSQGLRTVLVIDQLEELVTSQDDPSDAARFLDAIAGLVADPADPIRVIATLRHDFLGQMPWGRVGARLMQSVVFVTSPSDAALAQIVEAPLRAVGYTFDEEGFAATLVSDAGTADARLPLLQFALSLLWDRRDRTARTLRVADYRSAGSLSGMLVGHADRSLEALPPDDLEAARAILLALVTPARTRRLVSRDQLVSPDPARRERVLEQLISARLLSVTRTGDGVRTRVELAHESLAVAWNRLAAWLDDDSANHRAVVLVEQAAALWDARGRPADELWNGAPLDALDHAGGALAVTPTAREFIQTTRRNARGRARQRRLALIAVVSALAVVATGAAITAAELARRERVGREAHATALVEAASGAYDRGAFHEARVALLEALEIADSPRARSLWDQLANEAVVWRRTGSLTNYAVAFSADDARIAVGNQAENVEVIDAVTGELVTTLRGDARIVGVAYHPDGRSIFAANSHGALVRYADDGRIAAVAPTLGVPPARIRVAAEAGVVVAEGSFGIAAFGLDDLAPRWRLDDETRTTRPLGRGGELIAVRHGRVEVIDARAGRVVRASTLPAIAVAVAGEGHAAFVLEPDGGVRSWSVDALVPTSDVVARLPGASTIEVAPGGTALLFGPRHVGDPAWLWRADAGWTSIADSYYWDAAFRRDGSTLAVAWAEQVAVFRTRAVVPRVSRNLPAPLSATLIDPRGSSALVLTGNLGDGELVRWDLRSGRASPAGQLPVPVTDLAGATADGAAVVCTKSGFAVLDRVPLRSVTTRTLASPGASACALDPSRTAVAYLGVHGVVVAPVDGGEPRWSAPLDVTRVRAVAFSPEGSLVVSAADNVVTVFSARDGRVLHALPHRAVLMASFVSERELWTVGRDGYLRRWDPEAGQLIEERTVPGVGVSVAATAGAIYTGGEDGRISVLAKDGVRSWPGHDGDINIVRPLDVDGPKLLTLGDDASVRLWDARTGRPTWFGAGIVSRGREVVTNDHHPMVSAALGAVLARAPRRVSGDRVFCVVDDAGGAALWRPDGTRPDRQLERGDATDILEVDGHCLALAQGEAWLLSATGQTRLADDVVAIAVTDDAIALTRTSEAVRCDRDARQCRPWKLPTGISIAVPDRSGHWLVGFRDGALELRSEDGLTLRRFATRSTARVTRIDADSPGVLAVGTADGIFAVFAVDDGALLARATLNGRVIAIAAHDHRRVAVSDAGAVATLDLGFLELDRCAIAWDLARETHGVPRDPTTGRVNAVRGASCEPSSRPPLAP